MPPPGEPRPGEPIPMPPPPMPMPPIPIPIEGGGPAGSLTMTSRTGADWRCALRDGWGAAAGLVLSVLRVGTTLQLQPSAAGSLLASNARVAARCIKVCAVIAMSLEP